MTGMHVLTFVLLALGVALFWHHCPSIGAAAAREHTLTLRAWELL